MVPGIDKKRVSGNPGRFNVPLYWFSAFFHTGAVEVPPPPPTAAWDKPAKTFSVLAVLSCFRKWNICYYE